MALDIEELVF